MDKSMIRIEDKYYLITHPDRTVTVVRRDVYWTSGWKSPWQIAMIAEIEQVLNNE